MKKVKGLAGATLIVPVVNYWWPRLPSNLSQQAFSKQFLQDQWSLRVAHHSPSLTYWSLRVAHHSPSLTYWWNTQKWFLSLTVIAHSPDILSHQDRELEPIFIAGRAGVEFLQDQWSLQVAHHSPSLTYWWKTRKWFPSLTVIAHSPDILSHQDKELKPIFTAGRQEQVRQQGEYESIHRDLDIGFGTWQFDPTEIENPFPENKGSVHIWQGDEDILVPVTLQRYIAQQLPWIKYHELTGGGHMFPYAEGNSDAILKALLLGQS
ncbi:putative alpha/Beta hydrolase [Helianthus annuus]|nr:putative alpha/Beta hydrolase [Helianthus annuus]